VSRAAKAEILEARKRGAVTLLEEAKGIADEPAGGTASVQRNRPRADTSLKLASLFNRAASPADESDLDHPAFLA
jgi:hypothetical protein